MSKSVIVSVNFLMFERPMIRSKGEESKMIALISKLFILFTRSFKKLTLTITNFTIHCKPSVCSGLDNTCYDMSKLVIVSVIFLMSE